jgi:SAM-dependent methyltransferase
MPSTIEIETSVRVCPACGTENRDAPSFIYSRGDWRLKKCVHCNFVYLENPPHYEELSETFAWEQTFDREKERRRRDEPTVFWLSAKVKYFRRQVFKRDKLARLLKSAPPGNLLDVGCGPGAAFDKLPNHFIPHGVEVSKQLAINAHQRAVARGGLVIHADAISGIAEFKEKFFQVAILSSFLEHESQPRALLWALHRVMAPGGQVIIKVPNYGCLNRRVRGSRWCGFRFPDHVNYFTPQNLTRMVAENGFTIRRFGFRDHFPLSDNMWLIAERP